MKKIQAQAQNAFNFAFLSALEMKSFPAEYSKALKDLHKQVKSIKKEDRTFSNTILPLEENLSRYSDKNFCICLLQNVHPDKKMRDLAADTQVVLNKKLLELTMDKGIFDAVNEYKDGNYKKEIKELSSDDKKLFEDLHKSLLRMGFSLKEEKRNILKSKLKEINKLTTSFDKNIAGYQDFILCTKDELLGLPESYTDGLPKIGSFYKITLSYPHFLPFIVNAENREKRKEIWIKNSLKAGKKNLVLLNQIIKLRKEVAKILGYKNYLDFKLEDKMVKNSKNVYEFTGDLMEKVSKIEKKERGLSAAFAKKIGFDKVEPWDSGYIFEKLKKDRFDINTEEIKEYFQTEIVLDKMFKLFGDLFSFSVKEVFVKTWHENVKVYEVKDKESKKLLSYLALDLYPREGKYAHAAAFDTCYSDPKIVTLVCNFPTPSNKTPSLLSLSDVETIFHEFGHAMHFMMGETKHSSQNGFGVAWDFVETPSQFAENFIWNKENLKSFSCHFKTGKKLDDIKIKSILESRMFFEASSKMGQLIQTKLDLDIHLKNIKEPNIFYQKLIKEWRGVTLPKTGLFPASFGHLAHGYDAGYYSYLWALVYAEDIFSVFAPDIKNKEVGKRYRDCILKKGSSEDEVKMVEKFLQRKVSNKAFLKSLGL